LHTYCARCYFTVAPCLPPDTMSFTSTTATHGTATDVRLPAHVHLWAVWQMYDMMYGTEKRSKSVVFPEWVYAVDSETAEFKADIDLWKWWHRSELFYLSGNGHTGSRGQRAVKRVCVCVFVSTILPTLPCWVSYILNDWHSINAEAKRFRG